MHLNVLVLKILKTLAADTRHAIIGIVLTALIVGGGGILYLSRTTLDFLIFYLNRPTPIWATITLVLFFGMFTYFVSRKCNSSQVVNFRSEFGAFWDTELNMYCLSCGKPLKNSSLGPSIFFCSDPRCNSKHILKDDIGKELTRQEAMNILKSKQLDADVDCAERSGDG